MSPIMIKGLIAAAGDRFGVGAWQLIEHMAPKTLQQKLEGEGHSFHPFGDDTRLEGWKRLAQQYESATTQTPEKFADFKLTSDEQNNDQNAKKLREKYKGLADKAPGEDDQEKSLLLLRSWCVIKKTNTHSTSA